MNPYQQPQNNGYPTLLPVQNPQHLGYQPPSQYGNMQAGTTQNEERQEVVMKIAELDQGFNTCFMTLYKVWLWVLAILCTITFVYNFIYYLSSTIPTSVEDYIVTQFLLMVWNASQAFFGLTAITEKSLKKANVTCVMMCIASIPWACFEIFAIYRSATRSRGGKFDSFLIDVIFVGTITLINLIHIGLSLNGAFKVRKLLIDRGLLQAKLEEIDYAFKA